MTFQKIVIIIGIVLLIITLALLAFMIHLTSKSSTYPPNKNNCPDYWDYKKNEHGTNVCFNNSLVNKCKKDWPKPKHPNQPGFCSDEVGLRPDSDIPHIWGQNKNSISENDLGCMKFLWAWYEGVTWDGITNNKSLCKNSGFFNKYYR